MMRQPENETTQILQSITRGDRASADRLLALVYGELRALAGSYFQNESNDHTLQPTALVHEAFVRLVDGVPVEWNDRAHFFSFAATAMRRILTEHARKRGAAKRGGDWQRVTLDAAITPPTDPPVDAIALDTALTRLAIYDERKHQIVEMRFFAGLTVEEIAAVIGVSKTTIETEWRAARAWIRAEMEREAMP